jgi:hypothetical protein
MNKLLLLSIGSMALASCGIVELRRVTPKISNLEAQATFCTARDTVLDFQFDKENLITKLDVYLVGEDANLQDPSTVADALKISLSPNDLGNGKRAFHIPMDTNNSGQIQSVDIEAIVPANKDNRLWIRAFNEGEASPFVKSNAVVAPSNDNAVCDPIKYN